MRRTVNLGLLLTALLAFALGVPAFAAGGDSAAGGSTSGAGTTPTKITVGVLNVSDAAPLFHHQGRATPQHRSTAFHHHQ
jgi:hypothetical protein